MDEIYSVFSKYLEANWSSQREMLQYFVHFEKLRNLSNLVLNVDFIVYSKNLER